MTKILLKSGDAWPDPLDPGDVEWHMRHNASIYPHDRHIAADVIAAYKRLIFLKPDARERVVREIMANMSLEKK